MTVDCAACGITHASAAERDAMHKASERVRRWFRHFVTMAMQPVAKPKQVKRADAPSAKVQPRAGGRR